MLFSKCFLFIEAAGIIADICKAISFLHSNNIAHRDLKVHVFLIALTSLTDLVVSNVSCNVLLVFNAKWFQFYFYLIIISAGKFVVQSKR